MNAKKILFLSALLLSVVFPASAADIADQDMVYEIRSAGGTDNGCGFETGASGTDYSQQDSAHQTYTDLVIDATTNTDITSSADPFASDDVGNVIKITGGTGFTAGYYVIKSIPSGSIARLDRAVGTTSSTGGQGTLGGACILEDEIFEAMDDANTAWVKSDATYTLSADIDVGNDGNDQYPIKVIGYNTTRGDSPLPNSGNQPDINAGANRFRFDDSWEISYLDVDITDGDGFRLDDEGAWLFNKVRNSSGSGGRNAIYEFGASNNRMIGNDIRSDLGQAVRMRRGVFAFNYVHDSDNGIDSATSEFTNIIGNVFDTITNDCAEIGNHSTVINNTFYSCGIAVDSGVEQITTVMNNIFHSNTTALYSSDPATSNNSDYNTFYNNTADVDGWTKGPNDITTDPGFTNASGGDFSVGSAMKAIAQPQSYGPNTSNFLDLGAVQREEPAGGGGSGASAYTYVQ